MAGAHDGTNIEAIVEKKHKALNSDQQSKTKKLEDEIAMLRKMIQDLTLSLQNAGQSAPVSQTAKTRKDYAFCTRACGILIVVVVDIRTAVVVGIGIQVQEVGWAANASLPLRRLMTPT